MQVSLGDEVSLLGDDVAPGTLSLAHVVFKYELWNMHGLP